MQKALFLRQFAGLRQQVAELVGRRRFASGDGHGVADHAGQPGANQGCVLAGWPQPVEGVQHGQELGKRRGVPLDVRKQSRGLLGLGQLGIRQRLQALHGVGGGQGASQRLADEQGTPLGLRLVDGPAHPTAEQAVAAAQVVIQKAQGGADGEGVQPQRQLGQLHRHRVFVHPIDAAFEHHAAHDLAVVQMRGVDVPALRLRVVVDGLADGGDFGGQWRNVARHLVGLGQHGDHPVAQQVHQIDQKVARAHRRVAHPQFENGLGRVHRRQLRGAAGGQLLCLGAEGGQAFLNQRLHGFGQHQPHQVVRCVVAAGALAGEDVEADADATSRVAHQFVLQQALV